MTKVKVIITTTDGEVLDEFTVEPHKNPDVNDLELSRDLREAIEMRFNVPFND